MSNHLKSSGSMNLMYFFTDNHFGRAGLAKIQVRFVCDFGVSKVGVFFFMHAALYLGYIPFSSL